MENSNVGDASQIFEKNKILIIAIAAIFLIGVGTAFGYFIYRGSHITPSVSPTVIVGGSSISPTTVVETPSASPTIPAVNDNAEISWQAPQEIGDSGLWRSPYADDSPDTPKAKYYKVGTFLSGKYQGGEILLVISPCEGMCFEDYTNEFVKTPTNYVMLGRYSVPSIEGWVSDNFTIDQEYMISALEFPKTFAGPQPREVFESYGTFTFNVDARKLFFDTSKYKKVFVDSKLGDVYMDVMTTGLNGFYIHSADGRLITFRLVVDFFDKDTPSVIWNDGTKNQSDYAYTDTTGCGSSNFISVVDIKQVNPKTDLVIAGKNSFGDTVYELKNSNHPLLKDIYENRYSAWEGQKLSYADFVKQHPLFFWVDPFDRLIKFQDNQFVPLGECAKPVIYLYPEKSSDINVKIAPKGGLTYTEPTYNAIKGWSVYADTASNLIEKETGKSYPYLFWEGRGGIYSQPKNGFVVEKNKVHAFLTDKLSILGLNTKEAKDFMEFWEPKMQSAPYYFVSFLGNKAMDQIAPLDINPRPNTVIRILMDFSPLENPIVVKEPIIPTAPERSGFTVIEWGGVSR